MARLPAGRYYIGDLCYTSLGDKSWDEVCDLSFSESGRRGDMMTMQDGRKFVMLSTAHGDGVYPVWDGDNHIASLGVDSGTIGIIDADDAGDTAGGTVVNFPDPFDVFDMDSGTLVFGKYTVFTKEY